MIWLWFDLQPMIVVGGVLLRAGFFSTVPGFFWHVLGMRDLGWIFFLCFGFFVVDVSCGFHFDRGVQLVCRSCVQTLRLCVCV